LRRYATSRKVADSILDEVTGFLHYGPGVDSASNRNEYQELSWRVKCGLVARKAENLTAICEPIVYKM
jgi:hypothetical protein